MTDAPGTSTGMGLNNGEHNSRHTPASLEKAKLLFSDLGITDYHPQLLTQVTDLGYFYSVKNLKFSLKIKIWLIFIFSVIKNHQIKKFFRPFPHPRDIERGQERI
jgi:hypothetical protein